MLGIAGTWFLTHYFELVNGVRDWGRCWAERHGKCLTQEASEKPAGANFFVLCQPHIRSKLEKLPPKQQKTDRNPTSSATTKHFVFTSHEKLELREQPQGELYMQTISQQRRTHAILSWAHTVLSSPESSIAVLASAIHLFALTLVACASSILLEARAQMLFICCYACTNIQA